LPAAYRHDRPISSASVAEVFRLSFIADTHTLIRRARSEEEMEEFFKHAPHINRDTISINSFVKKMAGKTTRRLSLFKDPHREQEA
jgi:hypothetical protein